MRRGRPAAARPVEGEGELEVEDKPDRWAPPVGEREREREERRHAGFMWAVVGRKRGWVAG
jgi:hypothetical protein